MRYRTSTRYYGEVGMREGRDQQIKAGEGVGRSFRNPLQRTLGTGSLAAYAPHRGRHDRTAQDPAQRTCGKGYVKLL
jgi:hypothetical protein